MGELSKGVAEDEEEQRGHDKTQSVHGEIVVNAVKEEVEREEHGLVGQDVVDVEEEAVNGVFQQSPDDNADGPADGGLGEGNRPEGSVKLGGLGSSLVPCGGVERNLGKVGGELGRGAEEDGGSDGKPNHGNDVPGGTGEDLKVILVKEASGMLQVAGGVDLLQVELFGELGTEHLGHERLVKVEELVGLVVRRKVGLFGVEVVGDDDRVVPE